LNNAVRAPPICRKPVGDGAKRVMIFGMGAKPEEREDGIERVLLSDGGSGGKGARIPRACPIPFVMLAVVRSE
jgi:hypothetical protein